jgi:hypothetical protein
MDALKNVANKVSDSASKASEALPGAGPDQRQHPQEAPTRSTDEHMGAKKKTDMEKPAMLVSKQVGCVRRQCSSRQQQHWGSAATCEDVKAISTSADVLP